MMEMKTVLSIAGSDSCGGAGIQADIKTMAMNGVYGMTAITALTAQNTMGVSGIEEVSSLFLREQIRAVFEDIPPDAVKIGMLPLVSHLQVVEEELIRYKAKNIVLDPVMVSTSGSLLTTEKTIEALIVKLLPIVDLVTPNISEAEILSESTIKNKEDMLCAATVIGSRYQCNVLLKGGHRVDDADDLLYEMGAYTWFKSKRIDNLNTHGTGCTLSAAIASGLAKGYSLKESIREAKGYINGALACGMNIGKGQGPLNHAYKITNQGERR